MDEPLSATAQPAERIEELQILDEMKNSYLNYAMSVIVARALPDVRDGLKPSQRRILVAMNDLQLGPRSKHRKCAKIVGDTSGNYHPHGDQATYATLVRMGQDWSMRTLLIDPQGNFGSIDADPPAAMRYTEARLTQAAMDMLEDLKLDTVDFVPNYDETRMEPVVLPAKFPNLLVNGASGIAVGMATNIPPHNVAEVCDALLMIIDDPACGFKDILEKLPGPDFPTGGIICGRKGIREAYVSGRGHIKIRAKYHIENDKKGRDRIVFTEIPYMVVKTNIVQKIADCVKDGQMDEIADIRDESDRKGLRIVVELKKDADSSVVLNKLFRYTPLQSTFAVNCVALVNNRPELLNIRQLLQLYIDHRLTVIVRRTRHLLGKAQQRAHILEGLILAVSDIDDIINLIKSSPDAPTAKQRLMAKPLRLLEQQTLRKLLPETFVSRAVASDQFLTGPQADAILTMQLQRLTGLEIEKLAKEYAELSEKIADYEALLASRDLQLDVVREDLHEIKEKYKDPRRTEIIDEEADAIEVEDLIAEEQSLVTISHQGYIKRTPVDLYRKQGRGGKGVIGSETKEGDFLEHLFVASTHDYLLIFTQRGICHWLKVYNIPEMSRQSKGRNIVNLLNLPPDEKIMSIINVRTFDDNRYLMTATKKGNVKKTVLSAYGNPRSSGLIALKLEENDDLIGAAITTGNDEIILGTRDGMAIRFHEQDVRPMGRNSVGVCGIKLREGDEVVDMVVAEPDATLLTVCQHGYGKRTDLDEYRIQKRGGYGLINIKTTERNGHVVALKAVHDHDELMLITANGMIVRMGLETVRTIGRNTSGVRLMTLAESDSVVAVARLAKENGADESDRGLSNTAFTTDDQAEQHAIEDAPLSDEEQNL